MGTVMTVENCGTGKNLFIMAMLIYMAMCAEKFVDLKISIPRSHSQSDSATCRSEDNLLGMIIPHPFYIKFAR
jgi:hypothetical protein